MEWLLCLGIGLCSGFLGGLLGIGGGTVIVPALLIALPRLGILGADTTQIAVATSMAVIIPTSIASARAHALRGAVDWAALARLAPGVAVGSLVGTFFAAAISGKAMLTTFIAFALFAIWRTVSAPATAHAQDDLPCLPGATQLSLKGAGIGILSSLVGVGGGLLSVPLLAGHIPLKRAIGTGAALGLPLAAAGITGYVLAGHSEACGSACLGYIYLPAALATSLASVVTAPLGARLAHHWPVPMLKRAFALLLAVVIADLAAKLVA
jgi:uncharacterized membrane protein YfcA